MIALVVSIFIASILGSLHCAGMCGAFVAIAVGSIDATPAQKWKLQAGYHLGRLTTYVALGIAAGAAGQLLNLAGALAGLQPIAAGLAGATMVMFGGVMLLRLAGMNLARLSPPAFMNRLLSRGHRLAMQRSPVARAAVIGLCTTLLPCGWLCAFVIAAAGTASPAAGALAMAVFWLGTLPVLASIGMSSQLLLGRFGNKVSIVTCLVLMIVGMFTLTGRAQLNLRDIAARSAAFHQPTDPAAKLPCCIDKP
jgi:hypothetical protein